MLRLETLMLEVKNAVLALSVSRAGASTWWECSMDDLTVGGVYGSGATEGEARGKTLKNCNLKKGSCWEHSLECGVSK